MAPVRFETDRGGFGVVRFPRPKGRSRMPLEPLRQALETTLNVRFEARRERLFGPRIQSFIFMGERVKLKMLDSGDAQIDLSEADDEMREILIESLRQSHAFDSL